MASSGIQPFLEARVTYVLDVSPDGDRVLLLSNRPGTAQLYEARADGSDLTQLTDEREPVGGRYLRDGERLLVTRDTGGNERHQLYTLRRGGQLEPLVVDPEYMHSPGGLSRDGRLLSYETNRRNGTDFDVVVRDLTSGDERVVYDRGGWNSAASFSPDGRWLAVLHMTDKSGDNELYLVSVEGGEIVEVAAHDDDASVNPPAWLPDSSAFFFTTDTGRDTTVVARYEMADRSWKPVLDTGWETACVVDWSGRNLLLEINDDGRSRLELRDPKTLELREVVPLPGAGVVLTAELSDDGRRLYYAFTSPRVPGDVWCYDIDAATTTRLTTSPSDVPDSALVEPELHRFESFDGESVPAFLYRPVPAPDAAPAEPAPVVAIIHGGPEGQSRLIWNPLAAYFVARGYAVAIPNVRGSTGYGKRYQHLDDRRLRLDSVKDMAAMHAWLASEPDADESRVALYGGSYGGYMVLAGLTFQPELWAAGIDIVGISSLVTFLENTSAYRRRVREREYGFLDTDRDFLIEASPLTHIDNLRAPLFIIHGANDPRVPLSEAEQIHKVLADKGVATELLVYADEGHGLAKLANRLDAYPKAAAFLDEVLKA